MRISGSVRYDQLSFSPHISDTIAVPRAAKPRSLRKPYC